jgi:hypothetical protein
LLFRHLFDVVAGRWIVGKINHTCKTIQAVTDRNINRLSKDTVSICYYHYINNKTHNNESIGIYYLFYFIEVLSVYLPVFGIGDDLSVATTDVQYNGIISPCYQAAHFNICDWVNLVNLADQLFRVQYQQQQRQKKKKKVNRLSSYYIFVHLRPTQWFTPAIGLFHSCARVRATTATDVNGAPIPGPF